MYELSYLLEQAWLAHKEMGLGLLVLAELWIVAILVHADVVLDTL